MIKLSKSQQGKRLREVREELNLTQESFGKQIGKGRTTVLKWEKGEEVPEGMIQVMTNVFHINPHWLRTGEGDMFLEVVNKTFEDKAPEGGESYTKTVVKRLRSEVEKVSNKFFEHPGIRVWAVAGMGGGYFNPDDRAEPMEVISVEHLLNQKYRDAFRAWGQSMLPVIRHNALCFCDFNDKMIRSEEIYVFNLPSTGLVIKELRVLKEADVPPKYIIHSYNASPEFYSKDEIESENFIVGRVTLIHQETNK